MSSPLVERVYESISSFQRMTGVVPNYSHSSRCFLCSLSVLECFLRLAYTCSLTPSSYYPNALCIAHIYSFVSLVPILHFQKLSSPTSQLTSSPSVKYIHPRTPHPGQQSSSITTTNNHHHYPVYSLSQPLSGGHQQPYRHNQYQGHWPEPELSLESLGKMCYQLVELYSACRCLYYQHAVDRCAAYGRSGHAIQRRTILVGIACGEHSQRGSSYSYGAADYSQVQYSDSGYQSSRSQKSSRGHYR